MKRPIKIVILVCGISLFVIILIMLMPFKAIYLASLHALVYKKEPAESIDAIFTLAFEPERLEHSLVWKKKGTSAKWIISIGRSNDSLTQKYKNQDLEYFIKTNDLTSSDDVFKIDSACRHTFDEARLLNNLALEYGFQKVLIISAPYHMKRVKYVFDKLKSKNNVTQYYYSCPDWSLYASPNMHGYLYNSYHRRTWKDPLSMRPFVYSWKFLTVEWFKYVVYKLYFR